MRQLNKPALLDADDTGRTEINLRQLQYLIKIVELGNMTSAAHALGVAQPALGAQIRRLESELNTPLLVRHSRGVSATEAGKLVARRGRDALGVIEQIRREVATLGGSGFERLLLGVNPTLVLVIGETILPAAKKKLPNVALTLIEEHTRGLLDALDRRQVDMAFLFDASDRPGFKKRPILEEDLLLVSSPSRAPATETVSLAEALSHDLVIGGARGVIRNIVEREARRLSLDLKLAWEIQSISSMKATIASGEASSILPFSIVAEEVARGSLVCRRIDRPAMVRTLYLVEPEARQPLTYEKEVGCFLDDMITEFINRLKPWARAI
ncbi:MAG: hypothetical protein JWO28_1607 [Hyphomicrobiales bacterium]|nr:hypothetical protein [Hyphomicrobiales bacterium]